VSTTQRRTYVLLPGAWMGAWIWQFVAPRLEAAGHVAHAVCYGGVGERAAELSVDTGLESCAEDVLRVLERDVAEPAILVGHSFGSLIAGLVVDRAPERVRHLVLLDGGLVRNGISIFSRIPQEIVAKRQKRVYEIDGVKVLPPAFPGGLVIDDPELAAWTHRQLTPHPLRCYTEAPVVRHPPGNGRPITYIACVRPLYPVSQGNHAIMRAMPGVTFRELHAGHNAPISAPDLLADELLRVA
jgi:pimeloyl-ACP methyl ester carboxylesterase